MIIHRINQTLEQMSSIKRYSRDYMIKQESVLEHTGYVVLFCLFICEEFEHKEAIKLDRGKLLARAAIHDIDEVMLGDIPRVTKHFSDKTSSLFGAIEMKAVEFYMDKFMGWSTEADSLFSEWLEAKEDGMEGKVLVIADLAAVAYKCWSEVVLLGNVSFARVARECADYVNQLMAREPSDTVFHDLLEEVFNVVHGAISKAPNPAEFKDFAAKGNDV